MLNSIFDFSSCDSVPTSPTNKPDLQAPDTYEVLHKLVEALDSNRCYGPVAKEIVDLVLIPLKGDGEGELVDILKHVAINGKTDVLRCAVQTVVELTSIRKYIVSFAVVDIERLHNFAAEHMYGVMWRLNVQTDGHNYALADVFDTYEAMLSDPPLPQTSENDPRWFQPVSFGHTGQPCLRACSNAAAITQLHVFTEGMLEGVLHKRLVAAGGAVLGAVACIAPSDVDLFFVDCDKASALIIMTDAIAKILSNASTLPLTHAKVVANAGTITIYISNKSFGFGIQFVKRLYKGIGQIPSSFDICASKWVCDGTTVYCMRSAMYAVISHICIVNPMMATTSSRYMKYCMKKGFVIVVPVFEGLSDILFKVYTATDNNRMRLLAMRDDLAAIISAHALRMKSHKFPEMTSRYQNHGTSPCEVHTLRHQASTFLESYLTQVTNDPKLRSLVNDGWDATNPSIRLYKASGAAFLAIPPL